MVPTRVYTVDGRDIKVYDDLVPLSRVKELTDAFLNASFVCNEAARPDTSQFRHWVLSIPLKTAAELAVYRPTLDAVQEFGTRVEYYIYRCYCNYAAYGDMLFTHKDTTPEQKGLTALWYIAPEWSVEWGGETLFYNAAMDAEAVVTPRPGRLVVFDGTITHAGRPPNRVCYAPRYTLAFKLEPKL